ncbi:MAG TPA: tryptophan synthase subunit alpha [Candidatus Limnocylindrales bacterium]
MTAATIGSERIAGAFETARKRGRIAFVPYVVAGYPDMDTSERAALAALDAGADVLEIGLPYSDPLADGVTLQHASSIALGHGQTLDASLDLVERIHRRRPQKPLVVMGYVNQFMGPRGSDKVARRLADAGASGAIVADLTPDEGAPLERAFEGVSLALVYLVAPTSTRERVELIAQRSGGFVYCVSLIGVTGARRSGPVKAAALVGRVKARSRLPVAVGFGVARPEHVRTIAKAGADGVIVASALIDALGPDGTNVARFSALCSELSSATAFR